MTVSPMPPSLMARPLAVSATPGASNVMVTVEPLVTTIGWRTSSIAHDLAGAQHAARFHAARAASIAVTTPENHVGRGNGAE